jgi:hypothetical protein
MDDRAGGEFVVQVGLPKNERVGGGGCASLVQLVEALGRGAAWIRAGVDQAADLEDRRDEFCAGTEGGGGALGGGWWWLVVVGGGWWRGERAGTGT